jgi:hypothetical protein
MKVIAINKAEQMSGANTGPAHGQGMRKRTSQVKIEAGQSKKSFK